MGLLLGDVEESKEGPIANIWGVSVLTRSDKRADRVEISPEQLAMAAEEAANVGMEIGRETRVIGWYHSHPRITVQPSHVDLRTQSSYQLLDPCFVGLIFSVFNQEKERGKVGKMQLIAFQSVEYEVAERKRRAAREEQERKRRLEQEAELAKLGMKTFALDIPSGLFSSLSVTVGVAREAPRSFSARPAFATGEWPSYSGLSALSPEPIHPHDHEQVDVPIHIVESLPSPPNLLQKIVRLQEILFHEAQASFREAVKQDPGLLTSLHHAAVYQKTLCRLLEFGITPIMEMLSDQYAELVSQSSI